MKQTRKALDLVCSERRNIDNNKNNAFKIRGLFSWIIKLEYVFILLAYFFLSKLIVAIKSFLG